MMKDVHGQQDIEDLYKEKQVILKFGAPWCAPCKTLDKTLGEISGETEIIVAKVNVDEQPEIAGNFKVMSLPTTFIIKDGITRQFRVGIASKQDILDQFE